METQKEFWVKNTVCSRCLKVIRQELQDLGVTILLLELGKLIVKTDEGILQEQNEKIAQVIHSNGFELVQSEEEMLVERIKILLIELVSEMPIHLRVKTSEYLASELHREYRTLSRMFSKYENITIEKYFIKLKIEKVRELIQLKQYTFSDIAYLLGYSSINHLSRQFKEVTGESMSDYKNSEAWKRKFYDEII